VPKVGVHAIALNDKGHVLLVRRAYQSRDWNVPGGMMEDGEPIPEAVTREVLEETGYLVEVQELVALASRPKTNDVIIVVAAKIIEKRSVKVDPYEISEVDFFPFESLPEPMRPEVRNLCSLFQSGQRGVMVSL